MRRDRRRGERARLREAHRFGTRLARHWLAGREAVVRPLTPGAQGSLVAAAFRHGLVEGSNPEDAAEVAQAVLSGMAEAANRPTGRARAGHGSLADSQLAAARRGVAWMAEQALRGAAADYRLSRSTVEKIRSWSLERTVSNRGLVPLSAGRR